jgi:hypothetical protein
MRNKSLTAATLPQTYSPIANVQQYGHHTTLKVATDTLYSKQVYHVFGQMSPTRVVRTKTHT